MLNFKRLRALFLCLLILLIAGCTYTESYAVEIKVDLGITQFTPAPCGNWRQCNADTPYTMQLTSPSGAIGVFTDKSLDGWQFGAGIGYGGEVKVKATIHDVDNCTVGCGPLSQTTGQGADWFGYVEARKNFGKAFVGVDADFSRESWTYCNANWYGGANYSVGPIAFCVKHQVKTIPGLGLVAGYDFGPIAVAVKLIPTAATNSQYDPVAKQMTWYRPLDSSQFGYAFSICGEHTF
ncbi:MAG: hypothetical protein P4L91_08000 [Burkholderiaceae bacterium]|nr:hypothetical protein [Burkholderiaceae bacterium]